jgi:capsular exopolysaccharide synthesis family protein
MGRIDEALRRARAPIANVESRRPSSDLFVSVWEESELPVERPIRSAEPVERPIRSAEVKRALPTELSSATVVTRTIPASTTVDGIDLDWREKLALTTNNEGVIHQFRRLAAVLVQAQRSRNLKTIMVTSAVPGDGKTLTSLNLALVLSESYRRRVVLIEADFRRPRIGSVINLPMNDGLSDLMKSKEVRKVRRVQLTPNLTVLPAGRPDSDPVSGLTSARMQDFLQSAADEFDWVIVDTPPTSVAADASLLNPFTDATVLVIRAGSSPHAAVQQAVDVIGRDRILGVVLNGADGRSAAPAYYYHYEATSAD